MNRNHNSKESGSGEKIFRINELPFGKTVGYLKYELIFLTLRGTKGRVILEHGATLSLPR